MYTIICRTPPLELNVWHTVRVLFISETATFMIFHNGYIIDRKQTLVSVWQLSTEILKLMWKVLAYVSLWHTPRITIAYYHSAPTQPPLPCYPPCCPPCCISSYRYRDLESIFLRYSCRPVRITSTRMAYARMLGMEHEHIALKFRLSNYWLHVYAQLTAYCGRVG